MKIRNKWDLLQFESVKRMVQKLRAKRGGVPSKSTESGFLGYIFRYVKFYSMEKTLNWQGHKIKLISPDEIMKERKEHWMSPDDDIRRQHEEIVIRFMNMLGQEKIRGKPSSSGKVAYALCAVKALYKASWRELKDIPPPSITVETQYKVPQPKEMRIACENANPRLKTWILLDKDSGMSAIDLLNLTGKEQSPQFGTIKHQLKKGRCPIHIHIIREKTKTMGLGFYLTFFGEDAIEALQGWLKKRRRRRLFDIGERMLEIEFNKLSKQLGWKNFVPKSCRKYFNGRLKLANVNEAMVEFMMGHSLKRVVGAYIVEVLRETGSYEQIAKTYMNAYEHLKIPW